MHTETGATESGAVRWPSKHIFLPMVARWWVRHWRVPTSAGTGAGFRTWEGGKSHIALCYRSFAIGSHCWNVCEATTSWFSEGFQTPVSSGPVVWLSRDESSRPKQVLARFLSHNPWDSPPTGRASSLHIAPNGPREGGVGGFLHKDTRLHGRSVMWVVNPNFCFPKSTSWDGSHHNPCGKWKNKLPIINKTLQWEVLLASQWGWTNCSPIALLWIKESRRV